jgi:hypothetical protein
MDAMDDELKQMFDDGKKKPEGSESRAGDSELRKGAMRLVQEWRDWNQHNRPKGFEYRAYGQCAHALDQLIHNCHVDPNEASWLKAFLEAAADERRREGRLLVLLRSYRWQVIMREHLPPDVFKEPKT